MSYLIQKPKLPIGTPIPGYPAVEKALHSDNSCEVYLLEESQNSSLLFVVVSGLEDQVIIKWWSENQIEYFPIEKLFFLSQKVPHSFQAVIRIPGKWLGSYSPELNRKGLIDLLLSLVKLAKASESFDASPRYAPSLLWLSASKKTSLASLMLTSPELRESEIIQSIGSIFYTIITGVEINENQNTGPLTPLSRWCVNADAGLSSLITRCIDQDITALSDIEKEAISCIKEETLALPNLPRSTSKRQKLTHSEPEKPVGGGLAKVAGMRELKELLIQEVVKPIRDPDPYRKYGLSIPNGILLFGPPGCGKTYIARHLADELDHYFIEISPSEIASSFIHQTVLHIRDIFETAAEKSPSILFIDEFEAFVPARSSLGGHQQYKAEEVNEFLAQLNNCADKNIFVIAATNEPDKIDDAIRRTGRLDKLIYVGPPDLEARVELLKFYLQNRPLDEILDYSYIALKLDKCSASDIKFLVDESARLAMKNEKNISAEIILQTISKLSPSITHEIEFKYAHFKQRGI